MSIHHAADYSLIVMVIFVIVAGIVLSFCQQVEKQENKNRRL
jgi:hypothetical protein